MKTKIEIIKETASHYTSKNRGYDTDESSCEYITPEGYRCAVGRCIKKEHILTFQLDNQGVGIDGGNFDQLNKVLQDEYKGHSYTFWQDLQQLHDQCSNWNDEGLTDQGRVYYNELLEKYKDET